MSPRFESLLQLAVDRRASDLHIRAAVMPRLRVDGDLVTVAQAGPTTANEIYELHKELRNGFAFNHDDFAFPRLQRTWRANTSLNDTGPAIIIRLIPEFIPDLAAIGVPASYTAKVGELRGLHLITGPTGSGKTTTQTALVRFLSERPIKIITLEDPIEQRHDQNAKADVQQREFGRDFDNYPDALRAAVREDPDVILIAELRDHPTVRAALSAAETGHMVVGTMHNETAKDAVTRLLDACPDNVKSEHRALIAKHLVTCIAQQLVKRQTGGRVAVCELMIATDAIATLIRNGTPERLQNEIQLGSNSGMVSMNNALAALMQRSVITREVARAASPDLKNFDLMNSHR